MVTFKADDVLYRRFRAVAKARGHTMTWYLVGCMLEVVEGHRRKEVKKRVKKRVESSS